MEAVVDHPVLLTLKGKRGLPLKPLVWGPRPSPIMGESLPGLVARTASRNAFTSMQRVLRLADIEQRTIGQLPVADPGMAPNLAKLLNVEESDVRGRMYPPTLQRTRRSPFVDFFGTPIRASLREMLVRRTSPRSLKLSPHHRAVWDLRPFSFCLDSREILLSNCPVCTKQLGWSTTLGIPYCEHCRDDDGRPQVDLRDHEQPLVEVSDEAALDFCCDLVHPDDKRRDRARSALDPEFSSLSNGDLFEAVCGLAQASISKVGSAGDRIAGSKAELGSKRFNPEILSRAARALMTWPDAYCDLVDAIRAGAGKRVQVTGLLKEIGALASSGWNRDLPEPVRAIFARGNVIALSRREDPTSAMTQLRMGLIPEGYITQREAGRRLGMRPVDVRPLASHLAVQTVRVNNTLSSPVLYRASQIDQIVQDRRGLTHVNVVALKLGIPLWAVHALADKGHLVIEDGPAAVLSKSGKAVRGQSVDGLISAMTRRLKPQAETVRTQHRLITVVRWASRGNMPWVAIVEAILDGTLQLRETDNTRVGFTANVAVVDVAEFTSLIEQAEIGELAYGMPMTDREASVALGTSSYTVGRLVEAGILASNGSPSRRIEVTAIESFQRAYAFTPEVAALLKTKNADVRKRMKERGVEPVVQFGEAKQLVWSREQLPAIAAR